MLELFPQQQSNIPRLLRRRCEERKEIGGASDNLPHSTLPAWRRFGQSTLATPAGGIIRVRIQRSEIVGRLCQTTVFNSAFGTNADKSHAPRAKCDPNRLDRQPRLTARRALRWCGKWPSIYHFPVSTRFRHCMYLTCLCLGTCLQPSPCTSRRRHLFHRRTCRNH